MKPVAGVRTTQTHTINTIAKPDASGSFLRAVEASRTARTAAASDTRAADVASAADTADAYKAYLEKRFGPVTLRNVGRDRDSLEEAASHMRGNDVVIAPDIFDQMVNDPETAAYYEKKISYFFTNVIPEGTAFAASVGLDFQPCGVVVHPDGSVTYICGGGDPPEKAARIAKENREKQDKAIQRLRTFLAQSAEAAGERRDEWNRLAMQSAVSTGILSEAPPPPDTLFYHRFR